MTNSASETPPNLFPPHFPLVPVVATVREVGSAGRVQAVAGRGPD